MDFMNCPRCGKLFGRLSSPICKECEKEEEELFIRVRDYLEENPHSKVADVTEALGVSVKKIMRYLREGRLEASEGMGSTLRCEKCNKPIRSGHYCDSCVIELNQEVTGMFDADKEKGPKMHTFQDIKQTRFQKAK